MTDHYDALGVGRSASFAEIKAAYRSAARKHHPDLGGDAGKFAAINAAYDTLSDNDRRAFYDQTGLSERPPNPADVRAMQLIDDLFRQILDGPDHTGRWTFDIVARLRDMLNDGRARLPRLIAECQQKIHQLELLRERIDGAALSGVLAQTIRQLEGRIIHFETEFPAIERAHELLKDCRHRPQLDIGRGAEKIVPVRNC